MNLLHFKKRELTCIPFIEQIEGVMSTLGRSYQSYPVPLFLTSVII